MKSTYDRILEEGEAKGLAKGVAEGKAEGKAEGMATLLLGQLERVLARCPRRWCSACAVRLLRSSSDGEREY